MEKKIYYIEPVFEAKYWGGQALKGEIWIHSGLA